jgi:2-iminobutanoate/2-iminopropanoate deaminase
MPSIEYFAVSPDLPAPPLSAAARVGDLLFVSGTPGYHAAGRIDDDDFGEQFDQAVVTLKQVLERGGSSMRSIVKVNMLLTRARDVRELNERYAQAFGPGPYPARTTCVVAALPDPRMLLEIECIASVEAA